MRIYQKTQYEQLARSVLAGFPMSEAEKIIEELRADLELAKKERPEVNYHSEEPAFWLELQKGSSSNFTSIQVSKSTKDILESLKQDKDKGKETYEDVVVRLIDCNEITCTEYNKTEEIKMFPKELYDKLKGLSDEEFAKVKQSLFAEYGMDNVFLAKMYPLKVIDVQGITIERDVKGMKVVLDELEFRCVIETICGSGDKAAFKNLLSELNTWGYRLDRGLIMLELVNSEVDGNEIRFDCEYPINISCRIDPNTHFDVFLSTDGMPDLRFSITVVCDRNLELPIAKMGHFSNT